MLRENPQKRLNIYQVLREACHMRGQDVPIRDVSALGFRHGRCNINIK